MKLVQEGGMFLIESATKVSIKLETLLVAIAKPELLSESERLAVIDFQNKLESNNIQLEESEFDTFEKISILEGYLSSVGGNLKDIFTFQETRDLLNARTLDTDKIKQLFSKLKSYVNSDYSNTKDDESTRSYIKSIIHTKYSPSYNAISLADPSTNSGYIAYIKKNKEWPSSLDVMKDRNSNSVENHVYDLFWEFSTKQDTLKMIDNAEKNTLFILNKFKDETQAKNFVSSQFKQFASFIRQVIRHLK